MVSRGVCGHPLSLLTKRGRKEYDWSFDNNAKGGDCWTIVLSLLLK